MSLFCSLKNNNLRRLPKELGDCVALRTLSLNANDLVAIPDEMCKLRSVKRLTLAANNLQFLPWRMGDMVGLHMLDLSSNPIIRLPASLGLLNDILQKIELFVPKTVQRFPKRSKNYEKPGAFLRAFQGLWDQKWPRPNRPLR